MERNPVQGTTEALRAVLVESVAVSFGGKVPTPSFFPWFPSTNAQIAGLTQHIPDRAKKALRAAGRGKDAQHRAHSLWDFGILPKSRMNFHRTN